MKIDFDLLTMWLLEYPLINKQNNIRINNIFNTMLEISNIYLNFKYFIIMFVNILNNKNISILEIDCIVKYFICKKIHLSLIKNIIKYNEKHNIIKSII